MSDEGEAAAAAAAAAAVAAKAHVSELAKEGFVDFHLSPLHPLPVLCSFLVARPSSFDWQKEARGRERVKCAQSQKGSE